MWQHTQKVVPDMYFSRDLEDIEKEEQATAEKAVTEEEFGGSRSAFNFSTSSLTH
ncbi:unnamed protein product [Nyctereutes procyonoides]|uniref:(raccoon dog) hypothetical protein n=1 Tax=Nyctereutes procyonoides TaxID=34880 RepID=A0A811YU00_NYCPR|nr:unnamed protein product [Nyctereutes procyonoides]